jgi:ureidoglycolate lyase
MGHGRCVVLVGTGESVPDATRLKAFVTRPGQGWTLAPGTWHHALLALEDIDVAVIERQALPVDCETVELAEPVLLRWPV